MDHYVKQAIAARHAGRHDAALHLLQQQFDHLSNSAGHLKSRLFITVFEWGQLAEVYPAAHAALASARDGQAARLLAGDEFFGLPGEAWPRPRFQLILDMNATLGEERASHDLFIQLLSGLPELAQRVALLALPAIVAAGDFALAEAYLPDPLGQLEALNRVADELPLFPPQNEAPRVMAELNGFTRDVSLCVATLTGLGRADEAASLRQAALAGLDSPALRAWAQRELDAPGAVFRELQAKQLAPETIA
ncbi:hypothetical protein ACL9RI_16040 [Janthinobacterium sp. Mn2066]|uniref:hypothetical protein n=1 Tax=Janthinobacterium sp. Mn2066 TaxID=3395264 RepID=UPI003BBABB2C